MVDQTLLLVIILLFLCAVGISWFAGSDAPYVPTKDPTLGKKLKAAGLKSGKVFYELGSGDGRVVLMAAKLGANSFGIEQSWIRVWTSRLKSKKLNLPRAIFYHGNIFDREYYPADIVYIYLLPKAVSKLEKKLKKELKKGAIVITQTYHFKKWRPYKKISNFNFYKS